MSKPRHLNKAPIREAVIDIQISEPVSLQVLKEIGFRLNDMPNIQEEIWQSSFAFEINKEGKSGPNANADNFPIGYRYTFNNQNHVILCKAKGFTFSHLPPYGCWKDMRDKARELWEIYREVAKPQSVSRIAVRYINSIPIPLPLGDFSEYLNVPPIVPEGLPQLLASFLQRFVMVDTSSDTIAVVTQILEAVTQQNKAPILLDIDVYKEYIGFVSNTTSIWEVLEQLHDFKNRIFFDYLTEKTIRMFE